MSQPRYNVEIWPEDDVWMARHPALPGCMSDGPTPEAAIESLKEAFALYLEALQRRNIPLPPEEPGWIASYPSEPPLLACAC